MWLVFELQDPKYGYLRNEHNFGLCLWRSVQGTFYKYTHYWLTNDIILFRKVNNEQKRQKKNQSKVCRIVFIHFHILRKSTKFFRNAQKSLLGWIWNHYSEFGHIIHQIEGLFTSYSMEQARKRFRWHWGIHIIFQLWQNLTDLKIPTQPSPKFMKGNLSLLIPDKIIIAVH